MDLLLNYKSGQKPKIILFYFDLICFVSSAVTSNVIESVFNFLYPGIVMIFLWFWHLITNIRLHSEEEVSSYSGIYLFIYRTHVSHKSRTEIKNKHFWDKQKRPSIVPSWHCQPHTNLEFIVSKHNSIIIFCLFPGLNQVSDLHQTEKHSPEVRLSEKSQSF